MADFNHPLAPLIIYHVHLTVNGMMNGSLANEMCAYMRACMQCHFYNQDNGCCTLYDPDAKIGSHSISIAMS